MVVKNDTVTLHITGIDADIEKEEIKTEINKYSENATDEVTIRSLRPMSDGNQAATVTIGKETAKKIVAQGRIEVGWNMCRVRERVNILRCFKCLNFGHRATECAGEDKSDSCLKCGKTGHRAKECKNEAFCTTCGLSGHRADQTRCPHFRSLVNERQRQRMTRSGRKVSSDTRVNNEVPTD